MGSDSSVPVTAGSGTAIDTFQLAGGDHQQVVREAPATAATAPASWANSTTAATGVVAGDVNRRALILVNTSPSATTYVRYDNSAPTTGAGGFHDWLPPSSRTVVEQLMVTLPISFISTAANGAVNIAGFTAS